MHLCGNCAMNRAELLRRVKLHTAQAIQTWRNDRIHYKAFRVRS